jgi:hypothetical protein
MRVFLPQSVPAYAATETMTQVKQKYADYSYKEATLNPTNHRDRAADWEADLVQEFKNQPTVTQLSGERDTPTGRSLSIARPIKVTNPACLACHTTPEMAPATMIKRYGPGNEVRLEAERHRGHPGRVGAHPERRAGLLHIHGLAGRGVPSRLRGPERDAEPDDRPPHRADGAPGGSGQHGELRDPGAGRVGAGRDRGPRPTA